MKKIIALLLVLVLTVSLCACGASQPAGGTGSQPASESSSEAETLDMKAVQEAFESASAFLKTLADLTKLTTQQTEGNTNPYYSAWFNEAEIQLKLSDEFEVDGNKITIGKTTEKDLEAFDCEVEKYSDTLGANESTAVSLVKGSKSCVINLMGNYTDKEIPIADVAVGGFTAFVSEFTLPFNYNGLTEGSTIEEAIKIFGTDVSSVILSSDEFGTTISLSYDGTTRDGELDAYDSFTMDFVYDKEKNTATLSSLSRSHDVYPAVDE